MRRKYQLSHEYGKNIIIYDNNIENYDDDYLFENYDDALLAFEELSEIQWKNKTGCIYLTEIDCLLGCRVTLKMEVCK